jgi:hypothetical protein
MEKGVRRVRRYEEQDLDSATWVEGKCGGGA